MRSFVEIMHPTSDMRILDIGGYPWFWTESRTEVPSRITVLNTEFPPAARNHLNKRIELVVGDGTALDYADGAFDIVFSNSVIEHLNDFERQMAFAKEVQRAGRGYWIQTPAYEFPIEPHLLAPFIHWLPRRALSTWFVRYFTGWGAIRRPLNIEIQAMLQELKLLKRREVGHLFPDAEILVERFCGLPKSYVAFKKNTERNPA